MCHNELVAGNLKFNNLLSDDLCKTYRHMSDKYFDTTL